MRAQRYETRNLEQTEHLKAIRQAMTIHEIAEIQQAPKHRATVLDIVAVLKLHLQPAFTCANMKPDVPENP